MYGRSLRGNREISRLTAGVGVPAARIGKARGEANDAAWRSQDPAISSDEACGQGRTTGGGMGGAKGGDRGEHGTVAHRTQCRESVSQGLERVRQAARLRKKERFTALMHHVTVERLWAGFDALKQRSGPGNRQGDVARLRG